MKREDKTEKEQTNNMCHYQQTPVRPCKREEASPEANTGTQTEQSCGTGDSCLCGLLLDHLFYAIIFYAWIFFGMDDDKNETNTGKIIKCWNQGIL